jgi:hypothetical protein
VFIFKTFYISGNILAFANLLCEISI